MLDFLIQLVMNNVQFCFNSVTGVIYAFLLSNSASEDAVF